MRVLFVNKFLYPRAGAETYMFNLAEELRRLGHKVSFFGMEDAKNTVNTGRRELNVSNKDFHDPSIVKKLTYPFSVVYSVEARKKMRRLLLEEKPDIVHLNNINFQITPSVIYEIASFNIPMVMTLHDANIVCPNHSLYNYGENRLCTLCRNGRYLNCINTRCIHRSVLKSAVGCIEGSLYRRLNVYNRINTLIAPSRFIADMIKSFGLQHQDVRVLRNFSPPVRGKPERDGAYVLYFGRVCISKGMDVLLDAAGRLPGINFAVAGEGEYATRMAGRSNVLLKGFLQGKELEECIRNARMAVVPSNWHENCSMSILEAKSYGVPVIASDTGGNPEIVRDGVDGLIFRRGDSGRLAGLISGLYHDEKRLKLFSRNSLEFAKDNSIEQYAEKMCDIYREMITRVKEGLYECI